MTRPDTKRVWRFAELCLDSVPWPWVQAHPLRSPTSRGCSILLSEKGTLMTYITLWCILRVNYGLSHCKLRWCFNMVWKQFVYHCESITVLHHFTTWFPTSYMLLRRRWIPLDATICLQDFPRHHDLRMRTTSPMTISSRWQPWQHMR